jgi:putative flippase GtrA
MTEGPTGPHSLFKKAFVDQTDHILPQFLRYIWVGAITTVIDLIIMNSFLLFGSPTWIATSIGYMIGVVANYFICIRWIFKSDPSTRVNEFVGSMVVGLMGLLLNTLIVVYGELWLAGYEPFGSLLEMFSIPKTQIVCANTAKGFSVVTVLAWNFLARKYIIFRKKPVGA